jgi:hypothetical protein
MTWSFPGDREESAAEASPRSGVAQLIYLSELQSQERLRGAIPEARRPAPGSRLPTVPRRDVAPAARAMEARWSALRIGSVILAVALGILGQAWIGYQGRTTGAASAALWYVTLALIFTPSAALITSGILSDRARVWFSVYMSLALLATRFVLYPDQFVYHDELINYRVLLSIENTGHLFAPNTLLPVTAEYPGMEVASSAVHSLTGLSLHSSGIAILIAARIIMTVALVRIIQRVTGSIRVASLAALIYATNPQYVFFNSQFSYQSLALPMCFFCAYIFTTMRNREKPTILAPTAAVVVAIAATHHLTSLALVVVLWVWYLCTRITSRPVRQLFPLATISLVIVAAWAWLARSAIVPYIIEIGHHSFTSIVELTDQKSNHKFFTDSAGDRNPLWQVALSATSVLVLMSALIPALWLAVIKRRLLSAPTMVLFAMAAVYPIVPAGHLTNATAEVSDRASGFVFVGLGYLMATWWFRDVPFHRHARTARFTVARRTWLLVAGLTVCFAGGTVIGSGPDWLYGPGRYLVSADNRSVDQLALQAARWEGQNIPASSRVYTDRVNGLLAAVYGNQHVLTSLGDGIKQGLVSVILLSDPTPADIQIACQAHVEFLIADQRLASTLPHIGVYVDNGEYLSGLRTAPAPLSALRKFDNVVGADLIFNNGAIRVYDLRGLACAGRR